MRTFDCNCFSGNWPFHHVRTNTPGLMLEKHRKAGIDGGLMSSLEAIFYEDSWEADSRLSEKLSGTPYLHAQTINPLHPGWESMLLSGVKSGIRAVKIFPGFHGYQLNDPHLQTLCDALIQYNLPLVINLRMEDNRITYMFHP
ncbi:MAG: hypothetical protein GX633_06060 [Clostridiales bacterium]|jgi:hypothetical protein|nr:hypothetical protein [Clostridiales bacterium]